MIRRIIFLINALLLFGHGAAYGQLQMAHVTITDVTPSGFSVLWQASTAATPALRIFSDAAGTNDITSRFELTPFALRGGDPTLQSDYDQDEYRRSLRGLLQARGLLRIMAHGGAPGTTYYVKALSIGAQETVSSGLLPVTLATETGFQAEARQLLVSIAGAENGSLLVYASHPEASYPVSGCAGDGGTAGSVYLDLTNLYAADGTSWQPTAQQDIILTMLGEWGTVFQQTVTVNFTGGFLVAGALPVNAGFDTQVNIVMKEPAGRRYSGAGPVQISWTDAARFVDATVSLYYDTDDTGADGTLIVDALSEDADGTGDLYLWDTTAVADGTYSIYAVINDGRETVTAYAAGTVTIDHARPDSDGDQLSDVWEMLFFGDLSQDGSGDTLLDDDGSSNLEEFARHTDPTVPDVRLQLKAGTNVIAVPLSFSPVMTARDLLLRLAPALQSISRVNPATQVVEQLGYSNGTVQGSDFPLSDGAGYFLRMNYPMQDLLTGDPPARAINLAAGTNLVGFAAPGPASDTAYEILEALGETSITSIQRYNPVSGVFETAGFYQGAPVGPNFPIVRNVGYIITMKQPVHGFTLP